MRFQQQVPVIRALDVVGAAPAHGLLAAMLRLTRLQKVTLRSTPPRNRMLEHRLVWGASVGEVQLLLTRRAAQQVLPALVLLAEGPSRPASASHPLPSSASFLMRVCGAPAARLL